MPQMSSMDWLLLLFYFMIIFYLFMILLYFLFSTKMKKNIFDLKLNFNMYNLKWY